MIPETTRLVIDKEKTRNAFIPAPGGNGAGEMRPAPPPGRGWVAIDEDSVKTMWRRVRVERIPAVSGVCPWSFRIMGILGHLPPRDVAPEERAWLFELQSRLRFNEPPRAAEWAMVNAIHDRMNCGRGGAK